MTPDVGVCAQLACIWEVTARKPGNVHRFRDFDDVGYLDFIQSAAAIAPVLATACQQGVGQTILDCVLATRRVTATNTNLGIVLLLAPLAAVPRSANLRGGVARILADLDVTDARLAYEAIRLANPGGLGTAPEQDIAAEPTQSLRAVMALAADRDIVARQYANDFREVFDDAVSTLEEGLARTKSLEGAIIRAQLRLMAQHPDTLIARKCGMAEAIAAGERAARVLAAGWPEQESGRRELKGLDAWLRENGHRRNPGATADLLTAGLFVMLRESTIELPIGYTWSLPEQAAP